MSVIVIATGNLTGPGGSETYVMTVAEHLVRLGHSVTLLARRVGAVAEAAEALGIPVEQDPDRLPATVDAVLVLDREFALALGSRYPTAARVFIMHNVDDAYLPPPVPGCIHVTVALNERHAARARATTGAGTVVRLHQPIDMLRFSPRQPIAATPRRVAWLGNYGGFPGAHRERLREAWGEELEWVDIGGPQTTMDVPAALAQVDVVVGYGRSILEAMACGRAAYVFEHVGSAGWVTTTNFADMERDGFAGVAVRGPADVAQLRADLADYSSDLGWQARELVRRHHDAREHVTELMAVLDGIAPQPRRADVQQLEALSSMARLNLLLSEIAKRRMVEARLLAQNAAELGRAAGEATLREADLRRQVAEAAARIEDLEAESSARAAERADLERDRAQLAAAIEEIHASRRYRIAATLAAPLDLLRRIRAR